MNLRWSNSVRSWIRCCALAVLAATVSCRPRNTAATKAEPQDAGVSPYHPMGLTADQASQVLARVGERTITLGDFAATLERMNQFDRLRYAAPDRRRELLEEIIDVELLAQDARRKHLDRKPEVEQATRQILRDALLAQIRADLPGPSDIPDDAVRSYYESHRDEFREPERRRVAHILVRDRETALRVLAEAKNATGTQWGELVVRYSLDAPKGPQRPPVELMGDLGIVGPPEDARGDNPRIVAAVRRAVFQIDGVGQVFATPVADEGRYHVVRMTGKSEARERSLTEADRAIRVSIVQAKISEREQAFEAELRRLYPVAVDEDALRAVQARFSASPTMSTSPSSPSAGSPLVGSPSAGSPLVGSPSAGSPSAGSSNR